MPPSHFPALSGLAKGGHNGAAAPSGKSKTRQNE